MLWLLDGLCGTGSPDVLDVFGWCKGGPGAFAPLGVVGLACGCCSPKGEAPPNTRPACARRTLGHGHVH